MMYGKNIQTDETWKRIPEGSVGIEIGVWMGDSSAKFLRRASKLHLVDPWSPVAYEDSDEFGDYNAYLNRYTRLVGSSDPKAFQRFYDKVAWNVAKRFENDNVVIHRSTSKEFFEDFNEQVDWVYVDGSHAYDLVLEDLRACLKVIKPGGSIFGDDYTPKKPGVQRAVDDFCEEQGFDLEVFGPGNARWPDAQYEIKL